MPGLDIAANLFLGNEITSAGVLAHGAMRRKAQDLLARAGVSLDAGLPVASLRMGERQLVAIAKALSAQGPHPHHGRADRGALGRRGRPSVHRGAGTFAQRGVGIVYISHRLEEVARIAHRVTVMRDGAVVGTTAPDAPQADARADCSSGGPFSDLFPPRAAKIGAPILRLDHAAFDPDIAARRLAGPARRVADRARRRDRRPRRPDGGRPHRTAVGPARLRRERALARHRRGARGADARSATSRRPGRPGIAYVTDDRRGTGLVLNHTVAQNAVMSTLKRVTPFGLVSRALERREVDAGARGLRRAAAPAAAPRSSTSPAATSRRSSSPRN